VNDDSGAGRALPRLGLLRQISDQTVFDTIVSGGPATRAELATRTGISKPTVSLSIARLEAAGLVAATGLQAGRRGRVGTYYDVAASAGVVVGAELDQAGIVVRTVDLAGRVLAESGYPPTPVADTDALAAGLRHAFEQARTAAGVPIRAAGIAVANPVDPSTMHVVDLHDAAFPEGLVQPTELLRDLVSGPVLVDNNVNLAALAERRDGAAANAASFVYLYLGAALGAAVFVAGGLVRGAHGLAGEVSFLPAHYGSAPGDTLLRQLTSRGGRPTLDVEKVNRLLDAGPSTDRSATLGSLASVSAHATAALCAAVDPELVLLGGPIGAHPDLLSPFREALAAQWPEPVAVESSGLGERGPLQGAVQVALVAARAAALSAAGAPSTESGP
jgi:predicted NBD/HSP70 family sugar kinase